MSFLWVLPRCSYVLRGGGRELPRDRQTVRQTHPPTLLVLSLLRKFTKQNNHDHKTQDSKLSKISVEFLAALRELF